MREFLFRNDFWNCHHGYIWLIKSSSMVIICDLELGKFFMGRGHMQMSPNFLFAIVNFDLWGCRQHRHVLILLLFFIKTFITTEVHLGFWLTRVAVLLNVIQLLIFLIGFGAWLWLGCLWQIANLWLRFLLGLFALVLDSSRFGL
jgi:hypothetical protein